MAEQRFAANLREARESRGMSQYTLAQEMQDRGWPWRQQTVTRIETGQRMVRLGEATAIAEILQVPLDMLMQPIGESRDAELLTEWMKRARSAYSDIVSAVTELIITRSNLRAHPAVQGGDQIWPPEVQELAREARAVQQLTPDAAVAEAVRDRAREAASMVDRVTVVHPRDVSDAAAIAAALREGGVVILEIGGLPAEDARRFMDYASGALAIRQGSVMALGDGRYRLIPLETAALRLFGQWEEDRAFRLESQGSNDTNAQRDGA